MTIKATEIGKSVYLAAGFDMSAKTSVTVTLTNSSGTAVTVTDGRITVQSGTYSDPDLGLLAANEWLSFTTLSTDFPAAGSYTAYITYVTATKTYYSDAATITVTAVGS